MMLYIMRRHISYNVDSIEINLLSSLLTEKIFFISIWEKILVKLPGNCPELQIWRITQSFKLLSVAQLIIQLKDYFFQCSWAVNLRKVNVHLISVLNEAEVWITYDFLGKNSKLKPKIELNTLGARIDWLCTFECIWFDFRYCKYIQKSWWYLLLHLHLPTILNWRWRLFWAVSPDN